MPLDIQSNRSAQKYSHKELLLRLLWGFGKFAFKLSPRPCFGFRRWLLRCFGAKVGANVHVYPSALIYYPWNLEIGNDSAVGEWALIYNLGRITIGELTTISQRVHLCAGTHDYRQPDMPLLKPSITVGNEVWLCADCFVGPGIQIGNRVIVGARAVVVKDVTKHEIVAGNPAAPIKKRISGEGANYG